LSLRLSSAEIAIIKECYIFIISISVRSLFDKDFLTVIYSQCKIIFLKKILVDLQSNSEVHNRRLCRRSQSGQPRQEPKRPHRSA
jgi:hypothetical protein